MAGKDGALLPAAHPAVTPAPGSKPPASVGKGKGEERRFAFCPWSEVLGDLLRRQGTRGWDTLLHGSRPPCPRAASALG